MADHTDTAADELKGYARTEQHSATALARGDVFIDHSAEAGLHADLYAVVDRTFGPYWTDRGEVVDVAYRLRWAHVVMSRSIPTTRHLDIWKKA